MDTWNPIPAPTPERRRLAASRLRRLTAGMAVAGIAVTAGLGVLAANGYTGTAGTGAAPSQDGTQQPATGTDGSNQLPGTDQLPGITPPQPFGNSVLPPTIGRGPGHASTGGS
jgi:hypothetical protein